MSKYFFRLYKKGLKILKGQNETRHNKNEKLTIINDSYNASPDSMDAALKILGRYKGRRVAILGDILEMGEISEYGHRLVGKSSMNNTDIIITIGENSVFIGEEAKQLDSIQPIYITLRIEKMCLTS